jgi:hypothetical protein
MSGPLAFIEAFSEERGAALDRADGATELLLPQALAGAVGVPEQARLTEQPGAAGTVWVGFGSPVLERFLSLATSEVVWAQARLTLPAPPREAPARAAVERLALRNAIFETVGLTTGTSGRLVCHFRYTLAGEDRRDGLAQVTVSSEGRVPLPQFWSRATQLGPLGPLGTRPDPATLAAAAAQAEVLGAGEARLQSASFVELLERRRARDQKRMGDYFDGLQKENRARAKRAKVTAADVKQKTEAIERERAAKLKELEERSALKVSLALAAAVWVEAPVTIAAVRVRRRKLDRELRWEFDAATGQLLPLACEGCRGPADAPAFCDDRVHAICSGCVPRAEGRWDCPACRHKPG